MKNAMNAKSGVQKPSTSAIPEQISPSGTSRAKNARPGMATWPRYQRLTEPGAAACSHSLKRLARIDASRNQPYLVSPSAMKNTPRATRMTARPVPCLSTAMISLLLTTRSVLERHRPERGDALLHGRVRREQVGPEPLLQIHLAPERVGDAQVRRSTVDCGGGRHGGIDLLERVGEAERIARELGGGG